MWPRHCVKQSEGWKFHKDLVVAETDFVQAKGTRQEVDSSSGFFDNASTTSMGLDKVLRDKGISNVFVCGLAYDFCVGLTACDAAKLGFTVHLIEDLTRGCP